MTLLIYVKFLLSNGLLLKLKALAQHPAEVLHEILRLFMGPDCRGERAGSNE
jgi:hypothetical protein